MKKLFAGVMTLALAGASQAVELSTGIWMQSTGGSVGDATNNIDMNGLKDSNDVYLSVDVNMPLIIPDVKLRSQALTASGTVDVTGNVVFGDQTFSAVAPQDGELDLSYTDLVLNYGLPLPAVGFDFGVNLRLINGSLTVGAQSETLTLPVPMFHVAASLPTPVGVKFYGEYNFMPLGDANVTDIMVKGRYNLPLPMLIMDLGVEAGYHSFDADLNTTDYKADLSTSGVFVGLTAEF